MKSSSTATDSYFAYGSSSDTVYTVGFFGWASDDVVEVVEEAI